MAIEIMVKTSFVGILHLEDAHRQWWRQFKLFPGDVIHLIPSLGEGRIPHEVHAVCFLLLSHISSPSRVDFWYLVFVVIETWIAPNHLHPLLP